MDDAATLLEQLRDVRQPLPPEGVSLSLVIANVCAGGIIIALLWYRWRKNTHGWRKPLIKALRHSSSQTPKEALNSAAKLLRQLMLFRRQEVQTLSGTPWLQTLDEHFQTRWFTEGRGRVFGDTLYQPSTLDKPEVQRLLHELEALIRSLPAKSSASPTAKPAPLQPSGIASRPMKALENKAVES